MSKAKRFKVSRLKRKSNRKIELVRYVRDFPERLKKKLEI